jgi:hypothetical protein
MKGLLIPLQSPVLCMHAELFQWEENLELESLLLKSGASSHIQIRLQGVGHVNYADGSLLAPIIASQLKTVGKMDPFDMLQEINGTIVAYTDWLETYQTPSDTTKELKLEELATQHTFYYRILTKSRLYSVLQLR